MKMCSLMRKMKFYNLSMTKKKDKAQCPKWKWTVRGRVYEGLFPTGARLAVP